MGIIASSRRLTVRLPTTQTAARRAATPEEDLRACLVEVIATEKAYDVPAFCVEVGLQAAVAPEDSQDAFASKARYVAGRLDRVARAGLLEVADRVQERRPTFALGEALRRLRSGPPGITEVTRRKILDRLNRSLGGLARLSGQLGLVTFLERVWPLHHMPSEDRRFESAAADVAQHTEFNDDWDFDYLLTSRLGLLTASDHTFLRFLEELLHPLVRSPDMQQELAAVLNTHLARDGWRLEATDEISGQPVFQAVRAGGAPHAVKNLIFASTAAKPDLVLANALTNEIRIVRNAEHCLVYDQPIPADGLRWRDLVRWWGAQSEHALDAAAAERALYRRLSAALHEGIERPFFKCYFEVCRPRLGDRLPALVPQVYLHYDPKSVRERARLAAAQPRPAGVDGDELPLPRQRMDFLLLLPGQVRVVLELDGQQHYAVGTAAGDAASPALYARMVSADRDLRLDGYEVYRFGGYELRAGRLEGVIGPFFTRLFARHAVA